VAHEGGRIPNLDPSARAIFAVAPGDQRDAENSNERIDDFVRHLADARDERGTSIARHGERMAADEHDKPEDENGETHNGSVELIETIVASRRPRASGQKSERPRVRGLSV
jgi:hypothetical protein